MTDRGHARRGAPAARTIPGTRPAYELREENGRWIIVDTRADAVAVLRGVPQIDLNLEEAEELTSILNRLDAQRATADAVRESGD